LIPAKIENIFIEVSVNEEGIINDVIAGKFALKEFKKNNSVFISCPFLYGTLESLPENEFLLMEGMILNSDQKEYNVDLELLKTKKTISVLIHNRTHIYKTITQLNQNRNDLFFLQREISEKNKQLAILRKASDKANEEKSRFLAMMSHEIRNPLNTILGYTNLIAEEKINEKAQEYLSYLALAGKNLKVIVDDILDLSRIEAGKLELAIEEININQILKGVFINYKNQHTNNLVGLEILPSTKIPNSVLGDAVRITQILTNLMSNALKFTKEGVISLQSEVISENKKTYEIRFKISDTGRGMTAEQTVKIFEEYGQTELNDNRLHGGAGLGLSIVKRLVSAMKGSVSVASTPNVGTVFSVDIPFKKSVNTTNKKIVESTTALQKSLKSKQILLADDDVLNQKIATYFLEKENAIVTIVNDGSGALKILKNKHFDLIILDINMPGLTGEDLIAQKAILEKNATSPFLALTGNASQEYRENYMKIGFDEVIFKPYKPDELIGKISSCL
jgi:signal transduction histidine kinase/CheY-like chemotaxis protein